MRYARRPEVLWRSTSRGPVLLAPGADTVDQLGGLAAVVWEVLDRPLTASEVADAARAWVGEVHGTLAALTELEAAALVATQV